MQEISPLDPESHLWRELPCLPCIAASLKSKRRECFLRKDPSAAKCGRCSNKHYICVSIPEQYRESFREFIQVLKTREIHGIEPDDALWYRLCHRVSRQRKAAANDAAVANLRSDRLSTINFSTLTVPKQEKNATASSVGLSSPHPPPSSTLDGMTFKSIIEVAEVLEQGATKRHNEIMEAIEVCESNAERRHSKMMSLLFEMKGQAE